MLGTYQRLVVTNVSKTSWEPNNVARRFPCHVTNTGHTSGIHAKSPYWRYTYLLLNMDLWKIEILRTSSISGASFCGIFTMGFQPRPRESRFRSLCTLLFDPISNLPLSETDILALSMSSPPGYLAPLPMSQTKDELVTYLNMVPETYALMAVC